MRRLRQFFDNDVGGQSMRAGGATSLAENGVAPHIIQGIGRQPVPAGTGVSAETAIPASESPTPTFTASLMSTCICIQPCVSLV